MTDKFDMYDILGTIVPGTLLLAAAAALFTDPFQAISQAEFPEAFSVIVFTALAVFVGQLIQAVASLIEPSIYRTWGGRPSDVALGKDGLKGFLPADSAKRIRGKLTSVVGATSEIHSLFLYAMQLSDGQDVGRARRFNSMYAYHRALLVLVILAGLMLAASMIWGTAADLTNGQKSAFGVVVLLLLVLIWHRAKQRACYYVGEVLLTAERLLDNRQPGKE